MNGPYNVGRRMPRLSHSRARYQNTVAAARQRRLNAEDLGLDTGSVVQFVVAGVRPGQMSWFPKPHIFRP